MDPKPRVTVVSCISAIQSLQFKLLLHICILPRKKTKTKTKTVTMKSVIYFI